MDNKTRTEIMKLAIELHSKGHNLKQTQSIMTVLFPGSPEENIKFVVLSAIEMYSSFMVSVSKAGGSGWRTETALKMTLLDLISHLSTNGVRFVFEKE